MVIKRPGEKKIRNKFFYEKNTPPCELTSVFNNKKNTVYIPYNSYAKNKSMSSSLSDWSSPLSSSEDEEK